ncbi:MAG: SUF system Fe-S cluster assembly protein [Flavobacteriales bacterium]|nr:SUF system Fe-S cluster assembly protein [Flavobacteriales bacterium]
MTPDEKKQLEDRVIDTLKTVYDPEIPVDVYELGLIYEVNVQDNAHVDVKMTLTSPSCPVAESMPNEVEQKVGQTYGVTSAKVELTFEPPWDRTMMSEAAQLELGFM